MRIRMKVFCAVMLLVLLFTGCSVASRDRFLNGNGKYMSEHRETKFAKVHVKFSESESELTDDEISTSRVPAAPTVWYKSSRLIYHACGAVDGLNYTNSREALEETLSAGHRLVEVDFRFTLDEHLVCVHEWYDLKGIKDCCYLDVFLGTKIMGEYTPMTAEDIVQYMIQYPDLYIIVDTKEYGIAGVVAELINLCGYDSSVAERFIIQCYTRGDKAKITDVYPFPEENFLFSVYKFGSNRVDSILQICQDEGISVVAVHNGRWSEETMARFLDAGCIVFEHTVNEVSLVETSLKKGVYGFYTDSLQQDEIPKAYLSKEFLQKVLNMDTTGSYEEES